MSDARDRFFFKLQAHDRRDEPSDADAVFALTKDVGAPAAATPPPAAAATPPAAAATPPAAAAPPPAAPPPATPPAAGPVEERAPLNEAGLNEMLRLLDVAPDETLEKARAVWDSSLTEPQLRDILHQALNSLKAPDEASDALASVALVMSAANKLDVETIKKFLPDYDPSIPIDPGSRKFETLGDALGWVFLAGPFVIGSWFEKKAPFRWHNDPKYKDSSFTYSLDWKAGAPKQVALFSDFGTGLYHSRYIAVQLAKQKYPCAIHLGDVYYAGRQSEFDSNFIAPLKPVLANTELWAMPGNHEMYSEGIPYFKYLDSKYSKTTQRQEGSYFCLKNDWVQIIGMDTDYFTNFRLREGGLQDWLEATLASGRQKGLINILLTGDEPYEYGKTNWTALLDKDLRSIAIDKKLVDLWFWGNTHYCALFDRTDQLPFIGSCIGHGGYPYDRYHTGLKTPAPVKFVETRPRFPEWTGVRQDRGNNGYCTLEFPDKDTVVIHYIDWTGQPRCDATLKRAPGKPLSFDGGSLVVHP